MTEWAPALRTTFRAVFKNRYGIFTGRIWCVENNWAGVGLLEYGFSGGAGLPGIEIRPCSGILFGLLGDGSKYRGLVRDLYCGLCRSRGGQFE